MWRILLLGKLQQPAKKSKEKKIIIKKYTIFFLGNSDVDPFMYVCVWMFGDLCFVAATVIVYEMFFVKTTTIKKKTTAICKSDINYQSDVNSFFLFFFSPLQTTKRRRHGNESNEP